jgi:hypothetical protein
VDILVPFGVGLVVAGIIWITATILDKKRLVEKEKIEADEDLYQDED